MPRRRLAPGDAVSPARWPRGVSALLAITGILTLAYIGSTTLRAPGTSSFFFDVVIANLGYAGCTALCGWRAFARRRGRLGWGALAAGLLMFTSGSVLWTTWVQYFHPVPYPSIADGCFLTFFLLAFTGIALLVRETVPRTSKTIWVDGVIAALGVAALETTLVISPIANLNSGSPIIVATNLAYPIGDLVLVTMVVAVFAVRRWRPGRLWWMLGIGLVVFAAADSVYVLRVLSNTYVTGTPLDSLWLIGALFMSFAAWQRMGTGLAARNLPTVEAPNIIPVVFLLTSVGVVVYATTHAKVLGVGVVLATLSIVLAIGRSAYAFRQLRALADSRREARTDELTGLPNRRFFFERLAECLGAGATLSTAVLMIDLDRFKEINDSLGHHVGDDVLRELGPRLTAAVGSTGTVARLGGDEFGLVLDAPVDPAAAIAVRNAFARFCANPFSSRA